MKFILFLALLGSGQLEASAPEWFSDYVKTNPGCDRELLCVAGVGDSVVEALSEARSEAAKFFQTKIKAQSQISQSSGQKGDSPLMGSFDEWTNKTISEETSEMISGLELKRQEEVSGRTYVLMSLDRMKTAKMLKEKIEALDGENAKAFELNSRFRYPKILKNLSLIEAYNDRYTLVAQMSYPLRVKRENILEKINKLKPLKLGIVTKGKKLPTRLSHTLIEILSPLKIVIVPRTSTPQYVLRSEVVTEEEYFKVDGFKKLNVNLRLELLNTKSEIIGKLSALSQQVARTQEQAIANAIPEIKEILQNNLDQLSTQKMED